MGLNCRSGRLYVDGTVGGGGHAAAILDRIGPEGELWGLDRDPNVLQAAATRLAHHTSNFQLFQSSYAQLGELLKRPGSRGPQASSWTWACLLCSCRSPSVVFLLAVTNRWTCGSTRRNRAHRRHPVKPRPGSGVGKDFPGVWRGASGPAHRPPGGGRTPPAPLPDDPAVGEIVGTGPGTRGAQGETASELPGSSRPCG